MTERDPALDQAFSTAAAAVGDAEAIALLRELVGLAPTNVEDPAHRRWEKPNYGPVAARILEAARAWGLSARLVDPEAERPGAEEFHGIPRPNVIIDLDVGAAERVLLLAHYDVVPVPAEQAARWNSPPHTLTPRSDGRLYGRGANDDLGSGVVASLLALRRLAGAPVARNARLVVCCDEETGGVGGIEALKTRDEAHPPGDPERILDADVVLIPDGCPYVAAGSSGVLMLDGVATAPVTVGAVVEFGAALTSLQGIAEDWSSTYPAPGSPGSPPPHPTITGRATVTRFDYEAPGRGADLPRLVRAHAETEATNQIPQSVTLIFQGNGERLVVLRHWMRQQLRKPYRLELTRNTALALPTGALALSVAGLGYHAGWPHKALNPVTGALRLLDEAVINGKIDLEEPGTLSFGIDVRLPPEMSLPEGEKRALEPIRAWIAQRGLPFTVESPPGRSRGGYALPLDHPAVGRLRKILGETLGADGVYGEFGGTDASTLVGLTTRAGAPLPALVFGSMDPEAHYHEADESVDPKLIRGVAESIRRFIADP
ncbi:MAG TPA: M20/M25/M40 family metallo-hydrolase [Thermoplasmata archaeon]|nr:M20/M25/M40 family metallo-hydrolase [Thermoplasmata archaeon]